MTMIPGPEPCLRAVLGVCWSEMLRKQHEGQYCANGLSKLLLNHIMEYVGARDATYVKRGRIILSPRRGSSIGASAVNQLALARICQPSSKRLS